MTMIYLPDGLIAQRWSRSEHILMLSSRSSFKISWSVIWRIYYLLYPFVSTYNWTVPWQRETSMAERRDEQERAERTVVRRVSVPS
jgi:hypothetical protein